MFESGTILVRVTIVVMKDYDQKHLGVKRVYLVYASRLQFIVKKCQDSSSNRAGTWRLKLMERPWSGTAY